MSGAMTWPRAVEIARAEVERMNRRPDACGHVICGLPDEPIPAGETITFEVSR